MLLSTHFPSFPALSFCVMVDVCASFFVSVKVALNCFPAVTPLFASVKYPYVVTLSKYHCLLDTLFPFVPFSIPVSLHVGGIVSTFMFIGHTF